MEKINLSVERSFSDLITATINFMKQEFVPFIRAFAVIGFPVILLVLYLIKDVLMSTFELSQHPQQYGDRLFWNDGDQLYDIRSFYHDYGGMDTIVFHLLPPCILGSLPGRRGRTHHDK